MAAAAAWGSLGVVVVISLLFFILLGTASLFLWVVGSFCLVAFFSSDEEEKEVYGSSLGSNVVVGLILFRLCRSLTRFPRVGANTTASNPTVIVQTQKRQSHYKDSTRAFTIAHFKSAITSATPDIH
jgi:hypothetical protein